MTTKGLTIGLILAALGTATAFGQPQNRMQRRQTGLCLMAQDCPQFQQRDGFGRMGMRQRSMTQQRGFQGRAMAGLDARRTPQGRGFGDRQGVGGLWRGPQQRRFAGAGAGRLAGMPQLTPEQRQEMRTRIQFRQRQARQEQQAVQDATRRLNKAAAAGSEQEIAEAGQALAEAITQQALGRAAGMQELADVLTDEQRAAVQEIKPQLRQRMQQFRQQGRTDGGLQQRQRMRDTRPGPMAPRMQGRFGYGRAPFNPM